MLLRDQTRRTQSLHEAQVIQMRMWPRVFFVRSTKSEFGVDFERKKILYRIEMGGSKPDGPHLNPKQASDRLAECTQSLLGEDWEIEVRVGTGSRTRTHEYPGKEVDEREHLEKGSPKPSHLP